LASATVTHSVAPRPVQLVTFDLDGTLIDTHSPVRLALRLLKDDIMSKFVGFKLGLWALRYKAGRELDQSVP
jgi:FMN phosphatase YigB (HAD superfamily)